MNTYIKVGDTRYPVLIDGILQNRSWDSRESKSITLTMTYAEAAAIFKDGIAWSIVQEYEAPVMDESGNPTGENQTVTNEYDNSDFNVLGDVVVHRGGTCTVNMGKPTDMESLLNQIYGGDA